MAKLTFAERAHIEQYLYPGKVSPRHFSLLISMSGIRSARIIEALRLFLVKGECRTHICDSCQVTPAYFSIKLKQLRKCSCAVAALLPYYEGDIAEKSMQDIKSREWWL